MTIGKAGFRIYDNDTIDFEQDFTAYVNDQSESETELLTAWTGKRWPIKRKKSKVFEIIIPDYSRQDFETNIKPMRYKEVKFQQHTDEPTIEYDCLVTFVKHSLENMQYDKDTAIIKLAEKKIK